MQSESAQSSAVRRRRGAWALLLLLTIHLSLLLAAAVKKSACYDEGVHVAAGLAYWRYDETSIYNLSPPLLRYIAALPAYFAGANVPVARQHLSETPSRRSWNYFDDVQDANPGRIHRFVLWGRLTLIPFSLATAWLIWAWAGELYGKRAGLVSCALWCFSPMVLAQASSVGTDIGCTFAMALTSWCWQRFERRSTPTGALATAGAFAFALVTKFTALLLVPMLLLTATASLARRRLSLRDAVVALTLCGIVGFAGFNLCYGFRLFGRPLESWDFQSHLMQSIQRALPKGLPIPLPRDAIEGFDAQKMEADGVYYNVLFGRGYLGADWRFYPMQIGFGETIGGLLLGLIALFSFAIHPPREKEWPLLIAAVVAIIGFSISTRINLSARYLLPAYPFVIVLIGRVIALIGFRRAAFAGAAMVVEALWACPRYDSFANLATHLLPVNDRLVHDGGQSLIAVRRWEEAHPQQRVCLIYGGTVRPSEYGLKVDDSDASADVVILSKSLTTGLPIRTGRFFTFLRCWRELQANAPLADLDGMAAYSMQQIRATGVDPWRVHVSSWREVWEDSKALPFDQATVPMQRER